MNIGEKQNFIQVKAVENKSDPEGQKVLWSRHAITELVNDNLTRSQVEKLLETCEIIEDYPHLHRPLPDCLVLGKLDNTQPLHGVIAIDEINDRIFVVTVYRPLTERWKNDWRTRKQN
jgi:hypothetical protein